MSEPAIVFIGFMGAGKSTALAAARRAGLATTEIDELMEAELGMSIKQAFEVHGEDGFRAREEEVVGGLLENADGGAIALGGGSVLLPRVRAALERHVVVWLQVDAAEAWRRIAHSERPLATSAAGVEKLLAERLPLYEELADAVIPVGDRAIVERALATIRALPSLPAGTKLLWAASASGEYPILVGNGLLQADLWPLEGRRFLLGDETTMGLYGEAVGPVAGIVEVSPGERSKSLKTVEIVLGILAQGGMTREDHLIALGGGVIGDLGGFCAHLYQRGVPVVHLPTTLVAQVDSAYGGKTGVDLEAGKNYAGAYQLPAAVLADPSTLATLPREELAAGFVEVIKTGLLAGGALWERVRSIETLAGADLSDVVFSCARYKCEVVAADERDEGIRAALNLGHTVGHALEAIESYGGLRHGEAVGVGLLAALRLSGAPQLRDEVEALLLRHGLPTRVSAEQREAYTEGIMELIGRDKKRTAAGVGFVLLSEPGQPRVGQVLPADEVRAAVEELFE